jgi:glycosyltransferase involved in cell wall biosynthesis
MKPNVTICVLTYGDYFSLARRVIESIRKHCPRAEYDLVVGANEVSYRTLDYLQSLQKSGAIDRLLVSPANLNKNPMMRRMFEEIEADYIWWFDDDSYILGPEAFSNWLETAAAAPISTAMWGQMAWCSGGAGFTDVPDVANFVRSASWYRGLPPPSWRLGGKGEFDFSGCGCGDGRWVFLVGGCFLIRSSAVRKLDWPDPRLRKMGEDVFLSEAVRQQGWQIAQIDRPAVVINDQSGRGDSGSPVLSGDVESARLAD